MNDVLKCIDCSDHYDSCLTCQQPDKWMKITVHMYIYSTSKLYYRYEKYEKNLLNNFKLAQFWLIIINFLLI